VQVILPAADEPVRRGGHILTDQGWVVEDGSPVHHVGVDVDVEDQQPDDPAEDEE
jgi:hypothetical protein